jgi:hypothetical protein
MMKKNKITLVVATTVMAGLLLTGCSDTGNPKPTPSATAVTYPEPSQLAAVPLPEVLTNNADWVEPTDIPFTEVNELGNNDYELLSPTLREPKLNAWSTRLKKAGWSITRKNKDGAAANQYNFIAVKGEKLLRVDGFGGMKAKTSHDISTNSQTTVRVTGF